MFHSLENNHKCAEVFRSDYGIYSFVCYHCGIVFEHFEQVKAHIESHFAAEPTVIYSEEGFEKKYDLEVDNEIHIEPDNSSDHKDLFSVQDILDQKDDITDENVPCVNHVNIKTDSIQVDQNKIFDKKEKIICDICENEFSCKYYLSVHMKTHVSPFKCSLCTIRFEKVEDLREHGLNCHPNTDVDEIISESLIFAKIDNIKEPYKCNVCQKILRGKLSIFNHMSNHADQRQFKCTICCAGFNTKERRRMHMLLHDSNKPYLECEQCSKAFRKKWNLLKHLRSHIDDRPYPCKECEKTFKHSALLQAHIRAVHRKEKNAQCPDCGKTFFNKSYLNRHMKDHTEGPFTCEVCRKVFITLKRLYAHKRIHSDKRLLCDICDKSFKNSSYLSQHKLIHFDKTFQCRFCDMKFSQNAGKRCHETNFHRQIKEADSKKKEII